VTLLTDSEEALGEDEAALLVALSRCLRYDGQSPGGPWQALMRATTIYRARGDGLGMARAALEANRYNPTEWLVGLVEEALNALGESDLRLRARLLFMRAGWEFDEASSAAAAEAAKIAQTLDDPVLLGPLACRQAWEAVREKRIDEGVCLFRRAHGLLDEGGERQWAAQHLWLAAYWTSWEGKLDEGIAALKDALAYARKFHVRFFEDWCLATLQAAALIRCDFPQFDSVLDEVAPTASWARTEMSGDAEAALNLARSWVPSAGGMPGAPDKPLGNLARTSFNAGHEDQARKYLEECSKWLAQGTVRPHFRISAIAALDECLPALGEESLIQALYEELNEWKILRYAPSDARGLDHIRGALALRLERVDEAEAWYRTGLQWAQRERCPVEAGRCLQGMAEVAGRRRRKGEALRLLDEASVLFEAHGAKLYLDRANAARDALMASARGPIRPLSPVHPHGLSQRQLEVLRLVAQGKTNREIAAELVLSERTVQRHIADIYAKIGARNRAEATAIALDTL
jgi:DNA-binding CsgD family transcriptional regulator